MLTARQKLYLVAIEEEIATLQLQLCMETDTYLGAKSNDQKKEAEHLCGNEIEGFSATGLGLFEVGDDLVQGFSDHLGRVDGPEILQYHEQEAQKENPLILGEILV